jgi:1-phosphofructokinase family hexose kinase
MQFASVAPGGVNRATRVTEHGSGKSLNVARVAKTLGHPVLAIAPLGGTRGAMVRASMAEADIELDVVEVEPETRLCITVIVTNNPAYTTELVEEHAPLPPEAGQRLLGLLERRLPGAAVLVASGSLAAGLPMDFYASVVRMARAAGVNTVLDTDGEPLRLALCEHPAVVKINEREFETTLRGRSRTANMDSLVVQFQQRFGGWLVVTGGRDATRATDGEVYCGLLPPRIRAVSAIGSGDSFAAGLATAMADGLGFPDALRRGAACGAANALTPHAGHLDTQKVEELLPEVTLELVRPEQVVRPEPRRG